MPTSRTTIDSYALFNSRNITLGLSWPLFNRFQREQQVSERQTALDTERARAEDAKREVSANLTTQFAALDAARERIELTRLSVQAAQADVTVALERYRLGSIGITDLNAAEGGLTRAEESAVNARFEYSAGEGADRSPPWKAALMTFRFALRVSRLHRSRLDGG